MLSDEHRINVGFLSPDNANIINKEFYNHYKQRHERFQIKVTGDSPEFDEFLVRCIEEINSDNAKSVFDVINLFDIIQYYIYVYARILFYKHVINTVFGEIIDQDKLIKIHNCIDTNIGTVNIPTYESGDVNVKYLYPDSMDMKFEQIYMYAQEQLPENLRLQYSCITQFDARDIKYKISAEEHAQNINRFNEYMDSIFS